jgi:diguanylate cyclase (GGDEF)-like protein/PAS domain S-box-containing protein/putative nucleotidyltransferase with HDIG domain
MTDMLFMPSPSFFDTMQDMVFVMDARGKILYTNETVTRTLGYSVERCLAMQIPEFHPPEFLSQVQTNMERILTGAQKSCDVPLLHINGMRVPSRITVSKGYWNGAEAMYCIARDLTELTEATDNFRLAFEKNPSPMALTDLSTHVYLDVNDTYALTNRLHAYARDLEYKDDLLGVVFKVTQEFLKTRDPLSVTSFACETIGKTLDVSRVYLFTTDDTSVTEADGEEPSQLFFSQVAEWCGEGVQPYISDPMLQHVPASTMGEFIEILLKGNMFEAVVDLMPQSHTKQILATQGIVSIIVLPVFVDGTMQGFVGFDECRHVRKWIDVERTLLGLFIDSLAMALARQQLEQQLQQEKTLLRTTLVSVGDAVVSTDDKGSIVFMNPVAETLTGWPMTEAVGMPFCSVVRLVDERSGLDCSSLIAQVLQKRITLELDTHMVLVSKEGNRIPIEDSAAPIATADGTILGVVMVFRDFTEKKRRQDRIRYLSYHDQLTGLHNRRFFETVYPKLDVTRNLPMTLIMADVNGLKLTNDAFGHQHGDRLLRRVAWFLRSCRSDKDFLFRIGGDEFLMVLPQTTEEETLQRIESIQSTVDRMRIDGGRSILTLSIGYAVKNSTEESMSDVFKRAEDGMYRNKLSESLSMRSKTIDIIMNSLYEKSPREQLHSKRVSVLCELISTEMGLGKHLVDQMRIAGLMHDIGKIGIDSQILEKPGALDGYERAEIERHAEKGFRILSSANEFSEIALYVLEHHERLDGSGYPKGLVDDEISLQARILAVADTFDAMTSDRLYRNALPVETALDELLRWSGIRYDAKVVDAITSIKLRASH